ncbi:hypothetical protein B0H21DRAFT_825152 [Amylocystis lapponica]|nr:hypothetical protein B0H21DRAFT_825152 [Amylocystis lapponica]
MLSLNGIFDGPAYNGELFDDDLDFADDVPVSGTQEVDFIAIVLQAAAEDAAAQASAEASLPLQQAVEPQVAGGREIAPPPARPVEVPSRSRSGKAVRPSRKRKHVEKERQDDKENQPCKRAFTGSHSSLLSRCATRIQGTARDVRRHMDGHFPPRYECRNCHVKYPRSDRLVKHFDANPKCGEVVATVPGAVMSANRYETKLFATPRHEYFTVMPGLGKLRAPEEGHILESEYAEWRRVARSNGTLPDEGA